MLSNTRQILQSIAAASMMFAIGASAQAPAPAAPATPAAAPAPADATPPAPLSTFVLTGPLSWLPPANFDAGPFGTLSVNGIITGYSVFQYNSAPGDGGVNATASNGEVFIQKATGNVQWYVQAGVYSLPTLGVPFLKAQDTVKDLYGPVPVAYLKLQAGKTTQFLVGQLPTLMGAESTFTYQNFNIERGVIWNQETAISRGVQVNQTIGKYLSASLSWNDGYYSNRYSWLSASVTFTKGPHALVYDGEGNMGKTVFQTAATPVQNNGFMHAVIYTYTKGPWIISPYYQYGHVDTLPAAGITNGASAIGGAMNVSYAFKSGFSLPVRVEYLTSSGSPTDGSVNLVGYGPGSGAFTLTLTPTYQKGGMFIRGDIADVRATNIVPGDAFGDSGTKATQFRTAIELGFIFGKNTTEK